MFKPFMKNRFLLHPSVKFTISEYRFLPLFDFEFTITSIKIFLSPLNINKKPAFCCWFFTVIIFIVLKIYILDK